jgi:WD40 repeat protein
MRPAKTARRTKTPSPDFPRQCRGFLTSQRTSLAVVFGDLAARDEAPLGGIALSPNGRRLIAMRQSDSEMTVWDAASGGRLHTLHAPSGSYFPAAFAPSGKLVVTSCERDRLALWTVENGKLLRSLEGHPGGCYGTTDLGFAPDGETIVSAGDGGVIRFLGASGAAQSVLEGHEPPIRFRFLADGRLASGDAKGTLRIWNPQAGKVVKRAAAHAGAMTELEIAPDGASLVTVGSDGVAKRWNTETWKAQKLSGLPAEVSALRFFPSSPTGSLLLVGGQDGTVRIVDYTTMTVLDTIDLTSCGDTAQHLAVAADGSFFCTGGGCGAVLRFDLITRPTP